VENKSTPEKARTKKRKLPMEENGSSKRSRQNPEVGEFKEESVMEDHSGSKANTGTGVMEDEEAPAVDDGIPEETRNLSILPGEIRYRFHFQVVFNLREKERNGSTELVPQAVLGGMHVHVMSAPEILYVKSVQDIWLVYCIPYFSSLESCLFFPVVILILPC